MLDPAPQRANEARAATSLLALLIAATAVGPLSLNILMPAVPSLGATFGADAGTVQLTLSLFLLGMAVSQLILGPLSDRFGRRPIMLAGLAVTVAASVAALMVSSIGALIVARTVQACGATAGIVVGRAVIRDLYERDRAASMIGWVTMAMIVAPMIAPLIGGALDTAFGWQATFACVALFSAMVLAWAIRALPETRAVATEPGAARLIAETGLLIRTPAFAGYVLCSACNSAMFFAFLGGSPHVVVSMMGRSSAEYGLWFAASALCYMLGNFGAGRWSVRYGIETMLRAGVTITVIGAGVGLIWILSAPHGGPHVIFLPQMIVALASGFLLPNAIAGAISVRPQAAGVAAGITGFLQMGLGAAAAQLVGHLLSGASTALPMVLVIVSCGIASLVSVLALLPRR